jgi:hypothetical protein
MARPNLRRRALRLPLSKSLRWAGVCPCYLNRKVLATSPEGARAAQEHDNRFCETIPLKAADVHTFRDSTMTKTPAGPAVKGPVRLRFGTYQADVSMCALWRSVVQVMTFILCLGLSACTWTSRPFQWPESISGCWVMPNDDGQEPSLNLLPDPHSQRLIGTSMDAYEFDEQQMAPYLEFSFELDGSAMTVHRAGRSTEPILLIRSQVPSGAHISPAPSGWFQAAFQESDSKEWIVVSADRRHLIIFRVHPDGELGQTFFAGERIACRPDAKPPTQ